MRVILRAASDLWDSKKIKEISLLNRLFREL
jgi:hypothetical protein